MMNYEMFRELVIDGFRHYLSDQYKDMEMKIISVNKINLVKEGINLFRENEGMVLSPTVYIDDMYANYNLCGDLDNVISSAVECMEEAMQKSAKITNMDITNPRDNIVFQLVNTEQNMALLAESPHREFQDLSVIYRWVVQKDGDGVYSIPIKNDLAERFGFTEEQLFSVAVENTRRILPPSVKNINEIMYDIFIKDGMPPHMAKSMSNEMAEEMPMYVISNEDNYNGASSMLYEDVLQELASELESDLYILPSSVHEVMAVPATKGNPYQLAQFVFEVNMSQVELSERLSNQVYHYDKDLRKLSLATDTPNKRLDGKMAEAPMIYETGQHR